MNKPMAIPQGRPFSPLPQAPRKYKAADIFFFLEAGLLDESAKFELLDGEIIPKMDRGIVPMSPKGNHHEVMRERLMLWLSEPWRSKFRLTLEHTLQIDDLTIVEPDFILYDKAARIEDRPLTGNDIRLVVEVADSSWAVDRNQKALKYAQFGVSEYWVIHARKRHARIHSSPTGNGWKDVREASVGDKISPLCAPRAAFRLTK